MRVLHLMKSRMPYVNKEALWGDEDELSEVKKMEFEWEAGFAWSYLSKMENRISSLDSLNIWIARESNENIPLLVIVAFLLAFTRSILCVNQSWSFLHWLYILGLSCLHWVYRISIRFIHLTFSIYMLVLPQNLMNLKSRLVWSTKRDLKSHLVTNITFHYNFLRVQPLNISPLRGDNSLAHLVLKDGPIGLPTPIANALKV